VLPEGVSLWISGRSGEGGHSGFGKDGKFEIADVSPGAYTISAETVSETEPLFGTTSVEVQNADVDTLDIVLMPIPRIDGELIVEGDISADLKLGPILLMPSLPNAQIGLTMAARNAEPNAKRRFTVALLPGEYFVSVNTSNDNLTVKQITLDGKSAANGRLRVDRSPEGAKLVIVLGPKSKP
jgi:hypothetical protein